MHDRSPFRAIVLLLLVLAGAAAIGAGAYQAGVQHGFVEAGRTAAVPLEEEPWIVPGNGAHAPAPATVISGIVGHVVACS